MWAHKQDAPGKYVGAHESVRTAVYAKPPAFTTLYGHLPGADDVAVSNEVNNGMGVVAYRGHGSSTATATGWDLLADYYESVDVLALTNSVRRSPVVWSFACTNSALDAEDAGGEIWMEQVDHGSVSYYGATVASSTSQNHELDRRMFKAVYDLGLVTQSHAIEYAEAQMAAVVASGNAWMYLLLGDPDMQIRRDAVLTIVTIIPPEIPICPIPPCDITVQIVDGFGRPIPEALVGLWKPSPGNGANSGANPPDEVFDNRYTDINGMATIPASPSTAGKLYYAVEDGDGNSVLDSTDVVDPPTGVGDVPGLRMAMLQNYPNPFNPSTTIHYWIRETGHVGLKIYDTLGRVVRSLVDAIQEPRADGFTVTWKGKNGDGNPVASGVYFY